LCAQIVHICWMYMEHLINTNEESTMNAKVLGKTKRHHLNAMLKKASNEASDGRWCCSIW
jgi:hypothetical protein